MSVRNTQLVWVGLILSAASLLPGCPGAKTAPLSGYTPLPSVSVLVIVPDTTTMGTGSKQQFTAMVNNSAVQSVQWEVNGFPGGGGDVGTIDNSGNYTAPQFIPKSPHVTITAVANADNTKSGSAHVTITGAQGPATVNISPLNAFVQIGKTVTLTATVTGVSNTSVTWLVGNAIGGNTTLGTIRAGARNTAVYTGPAVVPNPATVTVTAVSNEDPTHSATADVTISKNPPDIATVTISPSLATVQAGHSFSFSASVSGVSDTSVVWSVCLSIACTESQREVGGDATIGTVTTNGVYTAPTVVPKTNPVYVLAASKVQPDHFATAVVTITPPSINSVGITLTPTAVDIQTGGSQQFVAAVSLGTSGSTDTSVTWQVNGVPNGNSTVGTIATILDEQDTVEYDAPLQVPADNPVIIAAIPNADQTIRATASVTITVPPPITVNVTPSPQQVQVGATQQFIAQVTNAQDQSVTWQVVPNAGCDGLVGSISPAGLYSAPNVLPPESCNPVKISATSNQDPKVQGTAKAIIVSVPAVEISLAPQGPKVQVDTSQQFTATVTNPTGSDTAVSKWQVNSVDGGNSTVGTIVAETFDTALYTAPSSVPTPAQVTVTAFADADPTKSAPSTVTIEPASQAITITVLPTEVFVLPGGNQPFTASLNGTQDNVVLWVLSGVPGGCTPAVCGTITAQTTGQPATYIAPSSISGNLTITVTAIAHADNTVRASSTVIVTENTTLSISVSPANPAPIAAGSASPLTFSATIGNAPPDTPVSWQLGCISLDSSLGSEEACGFSSSFDHGGPGCTSVNGSAPLCSAAGATTGPGNDPLIYTAPGILYTTGFLQNPCEETNDGSGNGQVPITAQVSFNQKRATATVCITVTPH